MIHERALIEAKKVRSRNRDIFENLLQIVSDPHVKVLGNLLFRFEHFRWDYTLK